MKHNRAKYRSGLEKSVAAFLRERKKQVKYEAIKIEWEDLRYRLYTPDFVLENGIIIETKGFFDSEDRYKHLEIKKQHPELDIRFIFSNVNSKLYKGSKTTYADWCDKKGFLYAHRVIPMKWLTVKGNALKFTTIKLKTKRRK
tara:strand:+ start:1291 stop:1719 length:429 start_codon:yes stop_codon:yes gene_type:complete